MAMDGYISAPVFIYLPKFQCIANTAKNVETNCITSSYASWHIPRFTTVYLRSKAELMQMTWKQNNMKALSFSNRKILKISEVITL